MMLPRAVPLLAAAAIAHMAAPALAVECTTASPCTGVSDDQTYNCTEARSCGGIFTGSGTVRCQVTDACNIVGNTLQVANRMTLECEDETDSCNGVSFGSCGSDAAVSKSTQPTIEQNKIYDWSSRCECESNAEDQSNVCLCKANYYFDDQFGAPKCVECRADSTGPGINNDDQNTKCLCNPNYYFSANACRECRANSEGAGNSNENQNDKCKCSPGYYFDSINENCEECQDNSDGAGISNDGLIDKCLCKPNYYFNGFNTCLSCPNGTLANGTTNEGNINRCKCTSENADLDTFEEVCKCNEAAFGEDDQANCQKCTDIGEVPAAFNNLGFGGKSKRCDCIDSQREERSKEGLEECMCKPGYFSSDPSRAGACEPCGRDEVPAFEVDGYTIVGIGRAGKAARCRCALVNRANNDDWAADTKEAQCSPLQPADVKAPKVLKQDLPVSLSAILASTSGASRDSVTAGLIACAVLAATLAI